MIKNIYPSNLKLEKLTSNKNQFLLYIFIFVILIIYSYFNRYVSGDNSVILTEYELLSNRINNMSILSKYKLFPTLEFQSSFSFLEDIKQSFFFLDNPFHIKIVNTFLLSFFSFWGFRKLCIYLFQDKFSSTISSFFWLAGNTPYLDYKIMGWSFLQSAVMLIPSLIYLLIYLINSRKTKYLFIFFILSSYLLISIQHILFYYLILLIAYVLSKKKLNFLFLFLLVVHPIILQSFAIFISTISANDIISNQFQTEKVLYSNLKYWSEVKFHPFLILINDFYFSATSFVYSYLFTNSNFSIYKISYSILFSLLIFNLLFFLISEKKIEKKKLYLLIFLIIPWIILLIKILVTNYFYEIYNFIDSLDNNFVNLLSSVFRDLNRLNLIIYFIPFLFLTFFFKKFFNPEKEKKFNLIFLYSIMSLSIINFYYLSKINSYKYHGSQKSNNILFSIDNFLKETKRNNFIFFPEEINFEDIEIKTKFKGKSFINPYTRFSTKKTFLWPVSYKFTEKDNKLYTCKEKVLDQIDMIDTNCQLILEKINFVFIKKYYLEKSNLLLLKYRLEKINYKNIFEDDHIIVLGKETIENFNNEIGINIYENKINDDYKNFNFLSVDVSSEILKKFDLSNNINYLEIAFNQLKLFFIFSKNKLFKKKFEKNKLNQNSKIFYLKEQFFYDLYKIFIIIYILIIIIMLLFYAKKKY